MQTNQNLVKEIVLPESLVEQLKTLTRENVELQTKLQQINIQATSLISAACTFNEIDLSTGNYQISLSENLSTISVYEVLNEVSDAETMKPLKRKITK